MATKRGHSPELVSNPFIKKRNLEWSLWPLDLSQRPLDDEGDEDEDGHDVTEGQPTTKHPASAAVEAGEAEVKDHLEYFSGILSKATPSPFRKDLPHLTVAEYQALYNSNFGSKLGAHFVIHQHDHPIAGAHYDLRLQINETSSASWAIMYGLPGDPNSRRLNRNATETRVHCLWVSMETLSLWFTED